jgi:hypothetical protein
VIDVLQWIAIGLLAVLVLLAHRLLGKHERLIREMAKTLASLATISAVLANTEMSRALRVPLVYCPTHGGQEQVDGRCVKCR